MTTDTGSAAGGLAQSFRSTTGKAGAVGVDAAWTAHSAVTLDTGVAVGMTSLAGIETAPGFPGMVPAPDVHARRDSTVEVAVVATTQGTLTTEIGVDRLDVAVNAQVKDPPVGGAGRSAVPPGIATKAVVAGLAGGRFMASGAEPGIGSGKQRMADLEITAMHIDQTTAELAHLHGRPLDMAVQAIVLLVTVGAIDLPVFSKGTMGETPKRAVGVAQGGQVYLFGEFLVMALPAGPPLGHDGGAFRQMAGGAGRTGKDQVAMLVMVEGGDIVLLGHGRPRYGQQSQNDQQYGGKFLHVKTVSMFVVG